MFYSTMEVTPTTSSRMRTLFGAVQLLTTQNINKQWKTINSNKKDTIIARSFKFPNVKTGKRLPEELIRKGRKNSG